jgi:hypothetical protein
MAKRRSGVSRRVVAAVVVLALLVAGWFGVRAAWQHFIASSAHGCTFGTSTLTTDQASVASTMVGVVLRRSLPQRAAVLTIAAGLQESKLTNLPPGAGDRDSVGVLQQRPSQGWGTEEQLSDVHYATEKFLDALVKVDDWQQLSLADAIQEVQRSAYGTAYAKHEDDATAIAAGFWGRPRGIACRFAKPDKAAPADTVAAQLRRDLPVQQPTVSGREIRVPGASWPTVAWLVANGDRLGLESVTYTGWHWTRHGKWQQVSSVDSDVHATLAKPDS